LRDRYSIYVQRYESTSTTRALTRRCKLSLCERPGFEGNKANPLCFFAGISPRLEVIRYTSTPTGSDAYSLAIGSENLSRLKV